MIIRVLIFICLLSPSFFFGQEDGSPTPSAIKLDFKLPSGISNQSFRGLMNGLADLDLNYSYHFENIHLIAGAGVKYGYWNLESASFPNEVVTGRMEIIAPFINLGYRAMLSETIFLDLELNGGFGQIFTSSNQCADKYSQSAPIFSPKLSINIRGTDLLYFGLNAGYTFMGAEFTPANICRDEFPAAVDEYNVGKYQYLSIGFGIYAIIPTFK